MSDEDQRILEDIEAMTRRVRLASLLRRIDEAYLQGRFTDALTDSLLAVSMDPGSVNTLYQHANILMSLQRFDEAANSYEKVLEIDPQHADAQYFLAAMGRRPVPDSAPGSYVTALFDEYAARFDEDLVDTLRYSAPSDIFAAVRQVPGMLGKKLDILDLGCGTGLCGAAFSGCSKRLVGVDLSGRMVEMARKRGIYAELVQSDINDAMQKCQEEFDLVLAGDVFIYIGNLDRPIPLAFACLRPGGVLAFSIEACESGVNYHLKSSGRYAHSPEYIQQLAGNSGFTVLASNSSVLRYERGQPIAGVIFVMERCLD